MTGAPLGFEVRAVGVEPGGCRAYDAAEWRGAIVSVVCGQIELECVQGTRRCFRSGDLLWFSGLPLRALHNPGRDRAVLLAVARSHAAATAD